MLHFDCLNVCVFFYLENLFFIQDFYNYKKIEIVLGLMFDIIWRLIFFKIINYFLTFTVFVEKLIHHIILHCISSVLL